MIQNPETIGRLTGDAIAELVSRFGLQPPDPYDQDWEICVNVPLDTLPHMLEHLECAEIHRDVRYTISAVLLARFDDLFRERLAWSVSDIQLRDVCWPRFVRALRSHYLLSTSSGWMRGTSAPASMNVAVRRMPSVGAMDFTMKRRRFRFQKPPTRPLRKGYQRSWG
jgi:hypothetical protein